MKSHVFPCAQCAAHGQNTTARLRQETCHQVWEAWTISLSECGIHSALKITIIRLESFKHVFQLFVLISAITTSSETITWQTTESHCARPQNLVSNDFCITHYSYASRLPSNNSFHVTLWKASEPTTTGLILFPLSTAFQQCYFGVSRCDTHQQYFLCQIMPCYHCTSAALFCWFALLQLSTICHLIHCTVQLAFATTYTAQCD